MYFVKPGRKSEKPGKNLKTWKKFTKPGKNFEKTSGNPVNILLMHKYGC